MFSKFLLCPRFYWKYLEREEEKEKSEKSSHLPISD